MSDEADPVLLARRYLDLWQRQFAAAAADLAGSDLTAAHMSGLLAIMAPYRAIGAAGIDVGERRHAGGGEAAGPAPAASASDDRDARLEQFARRLAACEERIAHLEAVLAQRRRGAGARTRRRPD